MNPDASGWALHRAASDHFGWSAVWKRYFNRLVGLARRRLAGRRQQRAADAEDVALSAFATFCRRARHGKLDAGDRDTLWPLLAWITACKAARLVRHECAQKRGAGKVRGDSVWADGTDSEAGIGRVPSADPSPEEVIAAAEERQRLLDKLDPLLRPVALLKLEDHANYEIAARLKVTTRTVERRLKLIRAIWEKGHIR